MYKAEIDLNASKMSIRFSKLVWGYYKINHSWTQS